MGNRLDSGWAYNEVDELNAGSGYAYDMKGALEYDPSAAGDPRLHFQYGSDDLLRQIDREGSTPLNQTSMTWDADEQRLQLTEQVSYDRWQFLYDAAVGIPAVLVQRTADQDNTTLGVTVYVREPGGELLASFEPGAGATYYHFDALGSTVLLSDSSGNPAGAYAYGAWGDVLAAPAAWQPYQYVGQLGYYTHTTSQGAEVADWLQLGVRFYQPGLGRFERRDPLRRMWGGYEYVGLAPLVAIDATGRSGEGKKPKYDERCKALAKRIPNLVKECQKRMDELVSDDLRFGWLCPDATEATVQDWLSHIRKYNEARDSLARALDFWNNNCRGNPPGSPIEVPVRLPAPAPEPQPAPEAPAFSIPWKPILGACIIGGAAAYIYCSGGIGAIGGGTTAATCGLRLCGAF